MEAQTPTTPVTNPRVGQMRDVRTNLRARFGEREAEIQGLLVAALAGEHVLLIGPPGTGKSALARAFADLFSGATYFETLLTRYSTPEEVFGPVSLSGLKADRFTRVTTGRLPEAHVAFLDEIFKANSAILNACLTALNERVFHNDGKPCAIPLQTCIGASNEMPEGDDLGALWDRFVVRHIVSYTKREDSFASMLRGPTAVPMRGVLTLADWQAIRADVDAVALPDATIAELFRLRATLAKDGVEASDRRWVKAAGILRAQAWLSGARQVTPRHFSALTSVLWTRPEDEATVRQAIQKYAGGDVARAQKMFEAVSKVVEDIAGRSGGAWIDAASSARKEIRKALDKMGEIRNEADGADDRAQVDELIKCLEDRNNELAGVIKTKVGLDF